MPLRHLSSATGCVLCSPSGRVPQPRRLLTIKGTPACCHTGRCGKPGSPFNFGIAYAMPHCNFVVFGDLCTKENAVSAQPKYPAAGLPPAEVNRELQYPLQIT